MRGRVALALVLALPLLAGCGSTADIVSGGTVPGDSRTIYSLLPHPGRGSSHDIVDGEKLAIEEAGGRAGGHTLTLVSLDESAHGRGRVAKRAGQLAERAVHDVQVIAVIGGTSSEGAMVSVPLIDAAGILHLLPGAGYPGFTRRAGFRDEPQRWYPSGDMRDVVRVVPDDDVQARGLVRAAQRIGGRARPRIAVEQEPGRAATALAEAVTTVAGIAGARVVGSSERADVVVYAGEDAANALGVARQVTGAGTPIVLPDAIARTGIAHRLGAAARRRVALVSSAPAPSSPALARLAPRFRAAFGRAPGPYAVVGYEAMRAVIDAIRRAGPRDTRRQAVTAAFRPPPLRGFTLLRGDGRPLR